jgi:WD40 repeat protein
MWRWDVDKGKLTGTRTYFREGFSRVMSYSPDGKYFVAHSGGGLLWRWDASTFEPIAAVVSSLGKIIALSPDCKVAVSKSDDRTMTLWDVDRMPPFDLTERDRFHPGSGYYSPDGKTFIELINTTQSPSPEARLWDVGTRKPIGEIMKHTGSIPPGLVAFRPDGQVVLIGDNNGTARLWDTATAKPIGEAMDHRSPITAMAFTPDGKTILIGSKDGMVRVWDAITAKAIGEPLKHAFAVGDIVIRPDGKTIGVVANSISSSEARLWDFNTGRLIGAPMRFEKLLSTLMFSPDNKVVLTIGYDRKAMLWMQPRPDSSASR